MNKRQLRRIIREEARKQLSENKNVEISHDSLKRMANKMQRNVSASDEYKNGYLDAIQDIMYN